jgi:phospholipase C
MGYYERADLRFHYALADAFTICDNYHCSVLAPTNPNRLFAWTGMIDPAGTNGGPVVDNSEAVQYTWITYAEMLQNAGVTWRNYQEADTGDDNPLAWFKQFQTAPQTSPPYQRGIAPCHRGPLSRCRPPRRCPRKNQAHVLRCRSQPEPAVSSTCAIPAVIRY